MFKDNNEVEKITLKKRGVTINPDQVALRSSPRFNAAEDLINQMLTDAPTQRAVAKLAQIRPVTTSETTTRRSPRLEGLDIIIDGTELDALRNTLRRAIARAPRRAARRRRESATTLLVADPPTALAVTAEGASCAARAVPSGSVSCMLAARRVPTDRFADGVPDAGREPSPSLMTNASSAAA